MKCDKRLEMEYVVFCVEDGNVVNRNPAKQVKC